ncbi:MAG: 1-deoxy-D-xylulose-5-phosphate synthase [Planctomycetes bacterium]|nr:1-deoxy-D-xylulose-5-phosphate synthase [Planctomycetota bacterium]
MARLIDGLKLPGDIKKLSPGELEILARDIRGVILDVLSRTGGHLASNLGTVELTLALHREFDFPRDKLIWDVGHQSYAHKIVTGRLERFQTLRSKGGLSGFPSPSESEFDPFFSGHAGTAVSSALGLSVGYALKGENRKVVAVVGDGSLCGLTFEGLNQAGALDQNLIIILNDNKMAISPTVGGLARTMNHIRIDEHYQSFMKDLKESIRNLPLVGESLEYLGERVMDVVKSNLLSGQFFREMGFRYYGPIDGHDLEELMLTLKGLRNVKGPILVHVLTTKGRGLEKAERDPETHHSNTRAAPQSKATGVEGVSYSRHFAGLLKREAAADERLYVITPAMSQGSRLGEIFRNMPERALDTGIAEAHAVTMACGLEHTGLKPVVIIYSTFLQRAYDSVMHDICLQKSGAVIFAIDRAGLVGDDGPSHHGVFDIALRHLPRMVLMAPRDGEELDAMFRWAKNCEHPVAIRFPREEIPVNLWDGPRSEIESGKPEILRHGEKVALLAYGAMMKQAAGACRILDGEGVKATLVNLRFAKPLCAEALRPLFEEHDFIFILEDHALCGGVGSALLELASDEGMKTGRIRRIGIPDDFVTFAERSELMEMLKMDANSLAEAVLKDLRALEVSR